MFNNIFLKTGVYHFPAPHEVFASETWSQLTAPAKAVFPFLLAKVWEQKDGDKSVMMTSDEIKAGTGLSSTNSVSKAREELDAKGLISSVRTKGGYIYEILNPLDRRPLVKVEDFNTLPTDLVEAYFMHHAASYDPLRDKDDPNMILCRCLFHHSVKMREKTLQINLSDGGYWKCQDQACHGKNRKGKLVAFELAMAEKRGKPITPSRAHSNIQRIVLKARRSKMQAEAEESAARRALFGVQEITEWGAFDIDFEATQES